MKYALLSGVENANRARRGKSAKLHIALSVCIALLLAPELGPMQLPSTARAQSSPTTTPFRVYAPHWSSKDGFTSTLFVRNVQARGAVFARLTLQLNGRALQLPIVRIDPLQTLPVDVAKILQQSGERTDQSGSAFIDFRAESLGGINAHVQVLNSTTGVGFSFPFVADGASQPGPLDAVGWAYSSGTEGYVAVQNTRDTATAARLTIFVHGTTLDIGQRLLAPNEAATIKLSLADIVKTYSEPQSFGVRVEYSGPPGSVVAQGWVLDPGIGFSAPFAFRGKDAGCCADGTQHLYGTGIAIGAGAMNMPGVVFTPYLAVRNISTRSLLVNPTFSYDGPDGPQRVVLPSIELDAQANTLVDLLRYQDDGTIPATVMSGNIDLQYDGPPGTVLADLASVDPNGSFVSPVPLLCNGNRALHMSYWRTDGDWHSSVTLQNLAETENNVEVTISFPGGTYLLNLKLRAGQSTMVSINDLQQAQTPDSSGHTIPASATTGGVNVWSTNLNDALVMNAMLANPVTKTCGSCGATGYVIGRTCADLYDVTTGIGFYPHCPGQSSSLWLKMYWSTSSYSCDGGLTNISSSNPSVASWNVGGRIDYTSPGSATFTATTTQNYPTDIACSTYQPITGSGTCNVVRVTVTIVSVGTNNTTDAQVTLTPSPFPAGVTLKLSRASGNAGEAKFTANNSKSLTVTQSGPVRIKGVTTSDTAGNMWLQAKVGNDLCPPASFTVVNVTLTFRMGPPTGPSGATISSDNAAGPFFAYTVGSSNLGLQFNSTGAGAHIWQHAVEIVGTVQPSNYGGNIILHRNVDSGAVIINANSTAEVPDSDDSDPAYRDDIPNSGDSVGKIYDLDSPGIGDWLNVDPDGTIKRFRWNFRQWAALSDGSVVSTNLLWYARLSIRTTSGQDQLVAVPDPSGVSGDNRVGLGTTKVTWNLQ